MVLVKLTDGKTASDFAASAAKAHAQSNLAAFKRPRYLAYVEEFPRTPTNKIAKSNISRQLLVGPVLDLSSGNAVSEEEKSKLLQS